MKEEHETGINLSQQALFGGALSVGVPTAWRDVSTVRPIPDHQEVYQDCTYAKDHPGKNSRNSLKGTGGMLVVEILDREESVRDEDAAKFFWQDLADANGGDQSEIDVDAEPKLKEGVISRSTIQFSKLWLAGQGNSIPQDNDEEQNLSKQNDGNVVMAGHLMPKLNYPTKACSCRGVQRIELDENQKKKEGEKASRVVVELCVLRLEQVQTDLLIILTMPLFLDTKKETKKETKKNSNCHSMTFHKIMDSFYVEDWSLFG